MLLPEMVAVYSGGRCGDIIGGMAGPGPAVAASAGKRGDCMGGGGAADGGSVPDVTPACAICTTEPLVAPETAAPAALAVPLAGVASTVAGPARRPTNLPGAVMGW